MATDEPDGGPPGAQTLIRGLRVIEAMADLDRPVGVGELSRQLELPKSTVQRLLRTLAGQGWAETSRDPVTRWQLSPRLLSVARRSSPSRSLREAARAPIEALGERSGETIHLTVPDGAGRLVLIERVDSVHPVRTFNPIGASTLYHSSASGKAMMALLPDDQLDAVLARPLDKVMPNTIVDVDRLREQVNEVRERGYAVNIAENRAHVCAVAAAVADPSGRPVAAVAISMPDLRFDQSRVAEWGSWVVGTARAITDALAD